MQDHRDDNSGGMTLAERVWGKPSLETMRGFLPLKMPYTLGAQFSQLNDLLDAMPVIMQDGQAGLLARNTFRQNADQLPDFSAQFQSWYDLIADRSTAEETKNTIAMDLAVAFRDYQYLKMGYLFEPVHHGSATASAVIPKNIANPFIFLANIFEHKPWLEYASGYILMNSQFSHKIVADQVHLIRRWHGGADERFFQTIHSIIEWETPHLFNAIADVLRALENDNEEMLCMAMDHGIATSQVMLERLKQMPKLSRPAYYAADVRPQIQGLVGNCGEGKLFSAQGVRFDSDFLPEDHTGYFDNIRGQTGAQSSVIPLLDNFLGITDFYAEGDNPLTAMLREFRDYRPKPHTQLLDFIESEQSRLQIRQTLKKRAPLLLSRWTGVVCQFREFHFYLAMAYIVKPGKNAPVAQSRAIGTGGSPTPQYLPQHVAESLQALRESLAEVKVKSLSADNQAIYHFWCKYVETTEIVNAERSSKVAVYLESEIEAEIDQTIESTLAKIEQETGV